jgi:hypothetical protein
MVRGKAALVLGFVLAAVFGLIFLQPVVGAVNDNTGQQSVTNETVTADLDSYVDLGGYDVDEGSVTVYGFNDTSSSYETVADADYDVREPEGELRVNSSASVVQDGETVKVSYDYQASDGVATTVIQFVPVIMATLVLFVLSQGVQRGM